MLSRFILLFYSNKWDLPNQHGQFIKLIYFLSWWTYSNGWVEFMALRKPVVYAVNINQQTYNVMWPYLVGVFYHQNVRFRRHQKVYHIPKQTKQSKKKQLRHWSYHPTFHEPKVTFFLSGGCPTGTAGTQNPWQSQHTLYNMFGEYKNHIRKAHEANSWICWIKPHSVNMPLFWVSSMSIDLY